MTICYFGGYNPNNTRNRIFLKALRRVDADVLECRSVSFFPLNLFQLFFRHWKIRNKYDIMIVGFSGQGMIWLAKLISKKPVFLDAFISLYNTVVEDREESRPYSIRGLYYYFLDWSSVRLADKIILDTEEHVKYFVSKFGAKRSKFIVVPVGTDEEVFYPRPKINSDKFRVGFHGTFIPLHGIDHIIKAAEILSDKNDIEFRLLGNGQTLSKIQEQIWCLKLNNVKIFDQRVSYEKLPDFIAENDICLGIFGDTRKAKMVVPNKVYECIAMNRPVITADTLAIREVFNEEELFLVKDVDGSELARAILRIKSNPGLSSRVASNAYEKFLKNFRLEAIGQKLVSFLK